MDKQLKVGCEVFIIKDGKLLMGKRKNCFGAGSWALPGGHLEFGEKLVAALQRELVEELDIHDAELELIAITDDPQESLHYLHISFELKNFDGEYKLMEPEFCEEWRFHDLDNLPENIFVPHQRILQTFKEKKLYLY
jgi:8-oxo-dGTP diphosphatase